MKKKIFAFDMDGIICENPSIPDEEINHKSYDERFAKLYKEAIPIPKTIELMKKLCALGHKVIIHTARWKQDEAVTRNWLFYYNVEFDALIMDKVFANFYIDDHNTTLEAIEKELDNDR